MLHIEAFQELGGVPAVIVPDNLKAAVIRAAFAIDGAATLNRSYRELARYYGFRVDPTPIESPKKKGEVEAGVKYVKRNFFRPRDERDVTRLRPELARWVAEIARMRRHGTAHHQPLVVFETLEKAALLDLPAKRAELVVWKRAQVHRDSHIIFRKALRIAEHVRVTPGKRRTKDEHLPDYRSDPRQRSRSYWEQRASSMGEVVATYVREVFDSDEVLEQLRTVQAIVTHLEKFPKSRAIAACERARFFGNHTYSGIKTILRKALDLQPLPKVAMAACHVLLRATPRELAHCRELRRGQEPHRAGAWTPSLRARAHRTLHRCTADARPASCCTRRPDA